MHSEIELKAVTDFPLAHPRAPYFEAFARRFAQLGEGNARIRLESDPRHAEAAGLQRVREGEADLAWVSVAYMEQLAPALGAATLPFVLTDSAMARPGALARAMAVFNCVLAPQGLALHAVMRGAEQLMVFRTPPDARGAREADLQSLRLRVTGPGHLGELVQALNGEPVPMPIHRVGAALRSGEIDGLMSSPGVWLTVAAQQAPVAWRVEEMSLLTYWLVGRAETPGPAEIRTWLQGAADEAVNAQWNALRQDDERVLADLAARGLVLRTIADTAAWRARLAPMARRFERAHPGVIASLLE